MRGRFLEQLEARQLLAVSVPNDEPVLFAPPAATIAPPSASGTAIDINAAAVRADLIRFVDTWNGGQLGKLGASGMGAYKPTWDGLFRTNLNRQFDPINAYTNDQTIISQSRAIYINVEAYRSAPLADQARFRNAVQKGADYLLSHAVDPKTYNTKPGGMWWGLQADGVAPPTHTTQIGGTLPRHKDAYGQVQSLFALVHAYSVTGDVDHLNGAYAQLDVWNKQFADTAAGAGAFLPTANEDYSQRVDTRNVDYMTHALEALLTLNDLTPAGDPRRAQLSAQVNAIGNFITTRMYRDAAGTTTMGYLPWYYDAQWNASADPAQRFMTPGHNLEIAFLLSRAVERGFNSAWLNVANKLLAFALRYAFDSGGASPTHGAIRYEKLKFDGTPFNSTPDNLIWWQTSEAARTLLHFTLVRGRADLEDAAYAALSFIPDHFVDPVYGGWYQSLNPTTLAPTTTTKGTVWTGGYHETMLFAEMLRLAKPASTPFTGTPIAIPSAGSATIQFENFDNGGEGVAYHDVEKANLGGKYRTGEGVDIGAATDSGGGYYIGYAKAGEWLQYSIDVKSAGAYTLSTRLACPGSNGKFHYELDGAAIGGALLVPNTGNWQTWKTLANNVTLPAGKHILRLVLDSGSSAGSVGNFNYVSIAPATTPPTSITIQAEDFDAGAEGVAYHDVDAANLGGKYRSTGVDIQATTDTGGGYNLAYVKAGEWLKYTTSITTAGLYDLHFRVASAGSSGKFHLEVDGVNVTGPLTLPNTAGWQNWTTISKSGIALTSGTHVLRLVMDANGSTGSVGNFNWLRLAAQPT